MVVYHHTSCNCGESYKVIDPRIIPVILNIEENNINRSVVSELTMLYFRLVNKQQLIYSEDLLDRTFIHYNLNCVYKSLQEFIQTTHFVVLFQHHSDLRRKVRESIEMYIDIKLYEQG